MPRCKIVLIKPWRTLLDQPCCVATKSHTPKAHRIQNFRHTRENMTTATKTNKRSKKLHNWTRRGFSVPSSRQCDESETTEIREKIHVKRNNKKKGTEHSEKPNENTEQLTITEAKNQSLPQHCLQLTSTRHKTNRLRTSCFASLCNWGSCSTSENLS